MCKCCWTNAESVQSLFSSDQKSAWRIQWDTLASCLRQMFQWSLAVSFSRGPFGHFPAFSYYWCRRIVMDWWTLRIFLDCEGICFEASMPKSFLFTSFTPWSGASSSFLCLVCFACSAHRLCCFLGALPVLPTCAAMKVCPHNGKADARTSSWTACKGSKQWLITCYSLLPTTSFFWKTQPLPGVHLLHCYQARLTVKLCIARGQGFERLGTTI